MNERELAKGKPKMLLFFGWRRSSRGDALREKSRWGNDVLGVVAFCVVLGVVLALLYVRVIRPWHG